MEHHTLSLRAHDRQIWMGGIALALVVSLLFVSAQVTTLLAQTPPPSTSGTTTTTLQQQASTSMASAIAATNQLQTYQTQVLNSAESLVTTAVTQGLTAKGLNPNQLASASKLAPDAVETLVQSAVADATRSGAVSLNQVSSVTALGSTNVQNVVNSAINEGIKAGTVSLAQVANVNLVDRTQLQNVVQSAFNAGANSGAISLTQVASLTTLPTASLQKVVNQALTDITTNTTIALSGTQQTQLINQIMTQIATPDLLKYPDLTTGAFSVAKLEGLVAAEVKTLIPSASITSMTTAIGNITSNVFGNVVRENVVSETLKSFTSGAVNVTGIQNMLASQVTSMTGLGNVGSITGAISAVASGGFAELAKSTAITQALGAVQGLTGSVSLSGIQQAIGGSIFSTTGLGSVGSIAGSFGALTQGAFAGGVTDAITKNALGSISGLTGSFNLDALKGALGGSISGVVGGNLSGIVGSLGSINTSAITSAIQGSVIANVMGQFGNLSSMSATQIQSLIGSQILSITGSNVSLSSITSMINPSVMGALSSVSGIYGNITQALGSIQGMLGGLTSFTGDLNNMIGQWSGAALAQLNETIATLQAEVQNVWNEVSTSFADAVDTSEVAAADAETDGDVETSTQDDLEASDTDTGESAESVETDSTDAETSTSEGETSTESQNGEGQSSNSLTPFGGMITYMFVCTCSANLAIYFNDYTQQQSRTNGMPLIYQPGVTTLYPFYNVFSMGSYILGLFQSGGSCTYYVGTSCSSLSVAGQMYMVGTSF